MSELVKLGTLIRRELVGELRTREVLTATLVFPPLVLVIFRIAFDAEIGRLVDWRGMTPGILWTALAFSSLNALLLRERIRCEEDALTQLRGYSERSMGRPRFPGGVRPR